MAENEMYSDTNMFHTSANNTANDMVSAIPNTMSNRMNGNAASQNNNHGLTTPVAPEDSPPVDSGETHVPTPPIAPEGGRPVYPGDMTPSFPSFPSAPTFPSFPTFPSTPVFPSLPTFPSIQAFGQVRFLNASTNAGTVNISVDNTSYAINSRFGTISNYDWISDGFHTVTVRRATGLRTILLQQNFPFKAGQKVTMVLTDSASGGLSMVQITDTGCTNLPYNAGCYRVANMSYSGSSFDVMLQSGEAVFRNVGFQEVTAYKQAMTGSYQFYLTASNNFTVIREIPIIVIGTTSPSPLLSQPIATFQVNIAARRHYTTYIIGNTWSNNAIRALTVED